MFYLQKLLFLGTSLISVSALAVPFWKAEKNGKHFYMLGTIHLGVSLSELQCHELIENKLKESSRVFTETASYSDFLNLNLEEKRKLYLGSKKEKEKIMNQLSEETQKIIQYRYNLYRLIIMKSILIHTKYIKDEGKFEDLSQKSQDFLKLYGLYAKNKSYYDYFFDLHTLLQYQAYSAHSSFLDNEIKKLALKNNIPLIALDDKNSKKILISLEEEIKNLEGLDRAGKVTKELINGFIEEYEELNPLTKKDEKLKQEKEALLRSIHSVVISNYKHGSRSKKIKSDAALKNRNEIWVEKILSHLKDADKPLFIAGGASHFSQNQDDNILDMLENKGFKITNINEDNCQF